MTPNDEPDAGQPAFPDELSPEQRRRYELWRALAGLSKAQAAGGLSAEQALIVEQLADNLRRLAAQMAELSELGRRYVELLEAYQDCGEARDEPGSSAVA